MLAMMAVIVEWVSIRHLKDSIFYCFISF